MKHKIQKITSLIILFYLFNGSFFSLSFKSPSPDSERTQYSINEPNGSLLWTNSELISNNSNVNSFRPAIAADVFGHLHIVWEERISSNNTILYRKCDSNTRSWSSTIVISKKSPYHSNSPVIKTDGAGNVHIVWFDFIDVVGNDKDIIYKFWNSSTDTWSPYEVVSTESTANSIWPDLDIDNSGNLHVVWMDNWVYNGSDNVDYDISYKTRNMSDGLWSSLDILSPESTVDSWWPSISVDNSKVNIAWEDLISYRSNHALLFKYKDLTTNLWSTLDNVFSDDPFKYLRPKIVADSIIGVHLVYNADSNSDIFYRKWDPNTKIWSSPFLVSSTSSGNAYVPYILADSTDDIHIFWFDETDLGSGTDTDIFYRYRSNVSELWGNVEIITQDSTYFSWRPTAAIDNNDMIHIVWHEETAADTEIYHILGFDPALVIELTFIYHSGDVAYEKGSTGNTLRWVIADNNVSNPTYAIYRNNTEIVNQTWISNIAITLNIDGLELGEYEYKIIVTDGLDYFIEDQVIVSISQPKNDNLSIIINISSGILIVIVLIGINMVITRRK